MKHFFTVVIALIISGSSYAQSVNDYKYVIVPEKYDFLKTNDQYQLNSLTTFLFKKYGFEAYLHNDDKPFIAATSRCEALYADVASESNFIQAKLVVILKDCNGMVVYKTSQGNSKQKDFKKAYHEALREAFLDIEELKYKYNGSVKKAEVSVNTEDTVVQEVVSKPEKSAEQIVTNVDQSGDIESDRPVITKAPVVVNSSQTAYSSEDGFYEAIKKGETLTFFEGTKVIGVTKIDLKESFPVTTSEFSGTAFFLEGRLVVQRTIKGVAGVVEMIFTKK